MNKPVFYIVSSMPFSKEYTDRPVIAECMKEGDAEETGAAMALAGFHAKVYLQKVGGDVLMHEFFPQPDGYGQTSRGCYGE